ncbi:OmpH family outer membrane protein [Chromobacterium amazonense]|uniref:OmpH family outer membrane protein n=1 Tax=Chromobacterium amazonense TaxID=1382803 RepID=A0A1S1XDK6_9NEIS|nr:OmpH family outer membrane protein [Chromobacterium amazonense]KIA80809.1 OmpH [Chromobacterium piscinae]MBM2883783.1 OmpH family outer membrane protein [Chromobacterium amazonense]MDE1712045.1 OmpH family outer membrane protein [Chromobacterium amazonense]MDQ4541019.1 OmpH family outer membrane protein [Chromobacterium amazonense]OHX18313.1 outer membrane protein chaperone [Chromobacterium amazonense]
MKAWKWWLAMLSVAAMPVHAADFKLGYINVERIYREAGASIAIYKKLDKEFSDRREELKKMETRAKDLESQLGGNSLSQDDRKRFEREYASLDRDYRAKSRELAEDYNQRRNEEFAGVTERANRVVKEIAQRENYDLILQDAVYINPKFDLTPQVLKELDK